MPYFRADKGLGLCLALLLPVFANASPVPTGKPAAYPDWWFEFDVIARKPASASNPSPAWPADYPTTDDFAAVNIGQLKQISFRAAYAMDRDFALGVSPEIDDLLDTWALPEPTAGLRGEYFPNTTLAGAASLVRQENVSFNWGSGSPGGTLSANDFSVRWIGFLVPSETGSYTFQTYADDGTRLWLGPTNLIDDWNEHGTTERTSQSITLAAGHRYAVRLEYFESGGDAVVELRWKRPGQSVFEPIPLGKVQGVSSADYSTLLVFNDTAVPSPRDDFAALNQGQLKTVAKLYYDWLKEANYQGIPLSTGQTYPWTATDTDDNSFSLVNIGQLKRVFSFRFDAPVATDADADGLSDAEEIAFGTSGLPVAPDYDEDGTPDGSDAYPTDPTKQTFTGTLSVTLILPIGATPAP